VLVLARVSVTILFRRPAAPWIQARRALSVDPLVVPREEWLQNIEGTAIADRTGDQRAPFQRWKLRRKNR